MGREEWATIADEEIQKYLTTGDYDLGRTDWTGRVAMEHQAKGRAAMVAALVAEVERRSAGRTVMAVTPIADLAGFARAKLGPMVRGFFRRCEQEPVLNVLEGSVIFLTSANIASVLKEQRWSHTAWGLANVYLGSVGAELLSPDAPSIVGLSEETTCYVSGEYFSQTDRFADFVVHEVAHVFHNCKRRTAGLPETRTREWLLDIEFKKRETFAYACEAYSRILELGRLPADRLRLLAELESEGLQGDETVNREELGQILRDAVGARNGWKRILAHCAPRSRTNSRMPEQVVKSINSLSSSLSTASSPTATSSGVVGSLGQSREEETRS